MLALGARLGAYEIAATLGAGGMGEVYRARDTRLQRDVALKFLPEGFSTDPERLTRFRREAQLLAALSHPNIATIYGLEEADGSPFLVMELVEGETLADRLARSGGAQGPRLPLDEALVIVRQVAEALHAAHEKGIVHRDLKPSNIAFTAAGDVKVLDFGLAKVFDPDPLGAADVAATHSPTLSVAATQAGVILGTASYMAPEQAKGRAVDKRADIWAFGCVLYEMLTGKRAFDGEDVTDIIGAVVRLEPDWTTLPDDCPLRVRSLLRRCLDKDPRKRIADISTALFVLDEAVRPTEGTAEAGHHTPSDVASGFSRTDRRHVALVGAAALVLGGLLGGGLVWLWTRPAPPRVTRTTITPPAEAAVTIDGFDRDIAITPDGTRVIYAGAQATRLFVRPLDALEPVSLVTLGGGGAQALAVSPDGQWVGYVENNSILKKVAITGGPPVTLLTIEGNSRGLAWAPDDTIIFAASPQRTGLQQVSAAGGSATVLTNPDRDRGELDHLWPEMLPDGRHVLFTITPVAGGLDAAQLAVLDLDTGTYRTILRGGSHAHYVATGHLVYAAAGTLRAVAFDMERVETRGTPVPVLPRLVTTPAGSADFGVASDGTLVYVDAPSFNVAGARTLVWVDRNGVEVPIPAPPRVYAQPRLSPDGSRAVVFIPEQDADLWVLDLERAALTRLTFEPGGDEYPVWMPDGRRIVFSQRGVLHARAADGTGGPERLAAGMPLEPTESASIANPNAVRALGGSMALATTIAPDGSRVVFEEGVAGQPRDLRMLLMPSALARQGRRGRGAASLAETGGASVVTLLETRFNERNAVISPDGRWIAYDANLSGQFEIYVRPFPNVDEGQWQVSTGGGTQPAWARSGRELFYWGPGGGLMAVPVEPRATSWNAGAPVRLFGGGGGVYAANGFVARMYDVSPDGQRFLMVKLGTDPKNTAPPQIVVVQNWLEELKRLVPAR